MLRAVTGTYEAQYVIKYNKSFFFKHLIFRINLPATYIASFSFPKKIKFIDILQLLSRIICALLNNDCVSGEI